MTHGNNEKDPYLVRVKFTKTIDPDRLDEWIVANFMHEYVEVVDRETGEVVMSDGTDPVPFVCPVCGRDAYSIVTSGGLKKYSHVDNEWCEVEQ